MIFCEQIRLSVVVLVGCFISLSRLDSLAFSVHQKSAYVIASSDPSLKGQMYSKSHPFRVHLPCSQT